MTVEKHLLRWLALGIAGLASACVTLTPVADLRNGQTGDIAFESANPYGLFEMVEGSNEKTVVKGTLVLPKAGGVGTRHPAIIVVHGSGGVQKYREFVLADRLAEIGVASFIVDSFGPRGVMSTMVDQLLVSEEQMTADAFAALRLLRTHPRIDAERIGILGYSKGGTVTLLSASRYVKNLLDPGGNGFAAHIAYYPFCGFSLPDRFENSPHLMLLGEKDDYTPPGPCKDLARRIEADAPIKVVEYRGAYHAWDSALPVQFREKAVGAGTCHFVLRDDGRMLLRDSDIVVEGKFSRGRAFSKCMSRGVTIGRNDAATQGSMTDTLDFVRAVLLKR